MNQKLSVGGRASKPKAKCGLKCHSNGTAAHNAAGITGGALIAVHAVEHVPAIVKSL